MRIRKAKRLSICGVPYPVHPFDTSHPSLEALRAYDVEMRRRVDCGLPSEDHLMGCRCSAECEGWGRFERSLLARHGQLDRIHGIRMARRISLEHRRLVSEGKFLKQREVERRLAMLESEPEYTDFPAIVDCLFRKYGVAEDDIAMARLKLAIDNGEMK